MDKEYVEINGVKVTADFEFDAEGKGKEPDPKTMNTVAPESTIEAMKEFGIK